MKTFQDLQKAGNIERFIFEAIDEHKGSEMYRMAKEGTDYSTGRNTAITSFKKLLYTLTGEAVPDNFSANHKCASNFLYRLTCQLSSYLLSNGVIFEQGKTKDKIDADLDTKLLLAAQHSLSEGVVFGFWNLDKIQYFMATEFVPLYDEETGALRAGIRFWQIASNKPIRATLYEEDGYTEYRKDGNQIGVLQGKRAYVLNTVSSKADGLQIVSGQNYESFPIVPLYANTYKQSELVPIKSQIDAYDLIKSGFANDLDDASMIYWTINNAGGMNDVDLAKFVERIKVVKAAAVDDDAKAEAHTIDVPYQSREAYLNRLEKDIIKDFMGLDAEKIQGGNVTATQIKAAYEPLSEKADRFEAQIIQHLLAILKLAGIEDYPKFRRSQMSNELEQTQMVMQCANILDTQTILEHLPFLTVDEVPAILERLEKEEADRMPFEDEKQGGSDNGTE
ncbi:MAG TPA: phage portal protein [Ruminococcus flavefaciens]|nr:phage portal protein [Ruminococcus flavefaciens]